MVWVARGRMAIRCNLVTAGLLVPRYPAWRRGGGFMPKRSNKGPSRPAGRGSVVLGAGDGVDVEPSSNLIVKRWPPARVTALMARLGQ